MRAQSFPHASARESRARLWRLLTDRRWQALRVLVTTGLAVAGSLAGPALIGVVVDAVVLEAPDAEQIVLLAAVAFGLVAVAAGVLQYLGRVQAAKLGESALAELRTEVFDHALGLPMSTVEQAGTGELVSRVTGDVTVLTQAVRLTLPVAFFSALQVAVTVVVLVGADWRLAGAGLLVAVPIAAAGGRRYVRSAPTVYRREREARAALATDLLETYRGAAVLTAYRIGDRRLRRTREKGSAVLDAELAAVALRNRLRPTISAAQGAALVAVVGLGSVLFTTDRVSAGTLTAAALYIVRLFEPFGVLFEEADTIQQAQAALARLVGLTQLSSATAADGDQTARPTTAEGTVVVDGLTTGYEPGVPVLRDVTLDVAAGERLVVVGASGAGKTSLAHVVVGALPPWHGSVAVGGRPVADLGRERSRVVALVSQDAHVFVRSVADNVRLGRRGATAADVEAALRAVGARSWLAELPHGLSTTVGTGHHELTPGQAQQVALARVVCLDPAIVVLDEATADLDPGAARRTEALLEEALRGRTVITIAHRMDVAGRADRVALLVDGALVGVAPHQRLLEENADYARLWHGWQAARRGAATVSDRL